MHIHYPHICYSRSNCEIQTLVKFQTHLHFEILESNLYMCGPSIWTPDHLGPEKDNILIHRVTVWPSQVSAGVRSLRKLFAFARMQ